MARGKKSDRHPKQPDHVPEEGPPGIGPADPGSRTAACLAARGGGPAHARTVPAWSVGTLETLPSAGRRRRRGGVRKLVYGTIPAGYMVLMDHDHAVELALLQDAIWNSHTWGEFRRMVPGPRLAECLERARMYLDLESVDDVPDGRKKFDGYDVGTADGDWPEWPARDLIYSKLWTIVMDYADAEESVHNGSFAMLDPRHEVAMVGALKRHGWQAHRDDELMSAASGCIQGSFRKKRRPQLENRPTQLGEPGTSSRLTTAGTVRPGRAPVLRFPRKKVRKTSGRQVADRRPSQELTEPVQAMMLGFPRGDADE